MLIVKPNQFNVFVIRCYFKLSVIGLFFLICQSNFGQNENKTSPLFFIPEILVGKTLEANTDFPETTLQKNIFLSLGRYNFNPNKEWAARLNYPTTGLSLGYTAFGNSKKVGHAYTLMPFIEFSILNRYTSGLNLHAGLGSSYMDTQFNTETNPFNRAITTKVNWSFRSFLYYDIFKINKIDWRFGLGYLHHSNGHTRLPNQGLNSLAASISAKIDSKHKPGVISKPHRYKSKSQTYLSTRFGIGQNVLTKKFNTKKEVYSFAMSAGKIINNTFKFGGGFYYRFYEHYYDYINNNEALVEEQFPNFRDNPYGYATNFGFFATSELLLDHFGFEFDLGLNIYKPFYKIDWQLSQGFSFENSAGETIEVLGELDWYYEIKRTVSAKMGLKYYLWSTNKAPVYNIFIGIHINANLGQADFTELSFGCVHRFNLKEKN